MQGRVPDVDKLLPRGLFSEKGTLLHTVRRTVDTVTKHLYVRVVDKGAGELWGFCKHWLWNQTEQFLRTEKYITSDATPEENMAETAELIKEWGWNANPRARFCVLCIIGTAKSLQKGLWLWWPIAAYPEPRTRKRDLRIAARACTCFLKHLMIEIPNNFQVLKVNDVAAWLEWVNQQNMRSVTELDYKEQFNKIQPGWVDSHMSEGIDFLTKRRRSRMTEVTRSVHHSTTQRLNRLGMGTNKKFRYLTHQELAGNVSFELQKNNKCWAVGQLWGRDKCIPMGGSFSAQSANLHSIWAAYKGRQEFRRLGALNVSPKGYIYWTGKWKVAMCQFRDNI